MHPGNGPGDAPADPESAISHAARVLRGGGVIAYPNESVYGLGCLPENEAAVQRILELKNREPSRGLILIAAEWEQFEDWVRNLGEAQNPGALRLSRGITWVVAAKKRAPAWITGGRPTIAVRRSLHPMAAALCLDLASPLVSTSCNPHGLPPARTPDEAAGYFAGRIDWVLPGECGPLKGPTEIRDAVSGKVLREG